MEFQECYEYLCDVMLQLHVVLSADAAMPTYAQDMKDAETCLDRIGKRLKELELLPPELAE